MALEFKKPEVKQQRIKILIYGDYGSGKSTLACAFPNTAYFDTEDVMSKVKYSKLINENNGAVISSSDIDKMISQVKELMTTKHSFKTVVIDSLSVAYENLLLEKEHTLGTEWGRHIAEADKKVRTLCNLLLRLDMNVIVTAHAKREYNNGNIVGQTYVGYKRLGYMFDLVLETSILGNNFSAIVKKSRLEGFQTGEDIKFSYQEVVKRCGVADIEKDVNLEVLASAEQIAEIRHLIDLLKVEPDIIQKWFTKANCDCFDEMPADLIQKAIKSLRDKFEKKKEMAN